MSKARVPKNLTFEKALARLEELVGELDDPEKGLEAALELFEEGVVLSRYCRGKLDEIQSRVEVVLRETQEGFETGPLDPGGEPAPPDDDSLKPRRGRGETDSE